LTPIGGEAASWRRAISYKKASGTTLSTLLRAEEERGKDVSRVLCE